MNKKILSLVFATSFLLSCGGNNKLNIKIVDEDYVPTLPTFVDKGKGAIKEDEEYAYFDFYEISDFHGAVTYNQNDGMLGIERLSTYFDSKRANNPGGTVVISSGDMWQGSADSNVTRGNLVTYSMNVMNFSAMTLGNHEFDWTVDWIKNNKTRANFPFLCANLVDKTTGQLPDFVQKSTIITRGDYSIGIVGTIGDNIKNSILASAVANYNFTDEVQAAKNECQRLRNEGCDIIVWNSHNDIAYLKDKIGTTEVGADVIFGGHTHTGYTVDLNDDVAMLESKDYGKEIPHAQLKINKTTREVSKAIIEIDKNLTSVEYNPDSEITSIVQQYNEKYINPVKNQNLGNADGAFDIYQLGNYAVETMYKAIKEKYPDYDIKAAFTNLNGGVRNPLNAGQITYGDIYSSFPFDNEIVVIETTGKKLQKLAAGAVSNLGIYQTIYTYGSLESSKNYLYVSTDFLASNTSYLANYGEVKDYTKLTLRDCIAEAICKDKTIKNTSYSTSAKQEFQKIKY